MKFYCGILKYSFEDLDVCEYNIKMNLKVIKVGGGLF
jgi:hypothetical protein